MLIYKYIKECRISLVPKKVEGKGVVQPSHDSYSSNVDYDAAASLVVYPINDVLESSLRFAATTALRAAEDVL